MKKLYFIGIVFEKPISNKIRQLKEAARDKFNSRWALRSEAHITLVPPFHYEEERIQEINRAVKSMHVRRFPISLNSAGRFGKKVIFVKADNCQRLAEVKKALDCKLEGFEIKDKTKRFHPHVTIAFKDLKEEQFQDAFLFFKDKCEIGISKQFRLVIFENIKTGWKILK